MSQVADMSSVTPDLRHQRVRLHKDRVVFCFLKDPDGKHREITTKVLEFYLDPRNFTLTVFIRPQLNCYSSTEYNPL